MSQPKLYTHALEAMQLYHDFQTGELSIEETADINPAANYVLTDKQRIVDAKRIIENPDLAYTVQTVAPYVDFLRGKKAHQVLGISEDASPQEIRDAKQTLHDDAAGRGFSQDQSLRSKALFLMENPDFKADVYAMQDQIAAELKIMRNFASGMAASLTESKSALGR